MRRCPVTRAAVAPGTLLLALEGERATNGWLLAGPGWVPPPRVDPSQANAEWRVTFCPRCDKHVARLTALIQMDVGTEVVCASLPSPDLDTILWPYELTFDGEARYVDGDRKVAGAGATLWHYPPLGGIHLASIVVALPDVDNAQIVEATGCRAALAALANVDATTRAARVVVIISTRPTTCPS